MKFDDDDDDDNNNNNDDENQHNKNNNETANCAFLFLFNALPSTFIKNTGTLLLTTNVTTSFLLK